MRKTATFYFYFVCLYWYPATVMQWGSYGAVGENTPMWFKLLRIILLALLIQLLLARLTLDKKFISPLIFSIYCIFSTPDIVTITNAVTFIACIAICLKIDIRAVNWKRHIGIVSCIGYLTALLEIIGVVVSPHSYDGTLRIVATYGGPNNAGIILSGFALYHFMQLRKNRKIADFLHFMICSILVLLTGSLSALIAYLICMIALSPRLLLLVLPAAIAANSISDFISFKIEQFINLFNSNAETISTFSDRLDNIQMIWGSFNASLGSALFGTMRTSESDYLNILSQYGLFGLSLFLIAIPALGVDIFLTLGLLQGIFTPFIFSFPSFAILLLLSRIYQKEINEPNHTIASRSHQKAKIQLI
ncbi:hypothetical protein [Chromobacterium sphagni]|uniref:Uncharacterized protein n=1 Tax=Chromobacterium sphagni TaxID=1903179 RepID=A0ABX3CFK9_9NEIS|nr:hypothetical protein [Chromobacterium sphagni]OHX20835.1 hypothetical protein BI344_14000 [Chromobacterium sphagni]